jgi:hypothetical protein
VTGNKDVTRKHPRRLLLYKEQAGAFNALED